MYLTALTSFLCFPGQGCLQGTGEPKRREDREMFKKRYEGNLPERQTNGQRDICNEIFTIKKQNWRNNS